AEAPARKDASCGSAAWTPLLPVHSTVTFAGHDTLGAVVSTTLTCCEAEAALCASSRAVHTTVRAPSGSAEGASFVTCTVASQASLAVAEPIALLGYPAGEVHSNVPAAGAAMVGAVVSRTVT